MAADVTASDEALMDRVKQGELAAFDALYARWRAPIYGYALRMTRQDEAADDVFQDTFLKLYRGRAAWSSGHGTFKSWIYRIATNAMRDRVRRAARRPEEPEVERGAPPDDVPSRVTLERALGALPEPMREAFLLGAVHGLDHNELAAALDISPDNARARVSRARARLRELLGEVDA
jgi:RNA polymerase sigma-70 factor (ECF subfamily)